MRQGGRLPAFNSHHFVSNMFWLLDGARERARAPGEDGAEGQGFKCDKEGINKIIEVLRMERRKTYGRADNDIVGGGYRQKMKVKLKRGELKVWRGVFGSGCCGLSGPGGASLLPCRQMAPGGKSVE